MNNYGRNGRIKKIGSTVLGKVFRDDSANVAIIFALATPVIIGLIGAGIDFSRASAIRTALQQAVDATSQTITSTVHTCHDKNRTDGIRQDTGCLNDPAYVAALRSQAASLLQTNFQQRGFGQTPQLVGPVTLDKITGRMTMQATSTYRCLVFQVLSAGCQVITAADANANLSTQADTLSISGPNGAVRIYVGQGTNLPLTYTATGGWAPYTFSVAGLPPGLGISHAAGAASARIVGSPNPTDATNCNLPNACDPLPLPATQLIAEDSGDRNRSGLNRQRVNSVINFTLIRPLRISLSGVMTLQAPMTSTAHYANATRSGGTGSYTYSCTGVPAGMTCNTTTGRVSGTPNYFQSGTLTVTVRDNGDGRTASATMPFNFSAPPLSIGFGAPSLVGNNVANQTVPVTASGGVGTVNVNCTGLPSGYSHNSNPGQQLNNGSITGRWNNGTSQEANGTLTCTATDQSGQSRSATLPWNVSYVGNTDCLTNSTIRCPGTYKGEFTNCINGSGRLACVQQWVYQGSASQLPESMVPAPNTSQGVPGHNQPCASDGTPHTAIKGCQGSFYGCVGSKGWDKSGYNIACYPKN